MRSGASASITSRRKPRCIAQRAAGIEHALVDRPTHVFQEAGEDPLVDRGDAVFGVEVDLRLVRGVVEALRCVHGWLLMGRSRGYGGTASAHHTGASLVTESSPRSSPYRLRLRCARLENGGGVRGVADDAERCEAHGGRGLLALCRKAALEDADFDRKRKEAF